MAPSTYAQAAEFQGLRFRIRVGLGSMGPGDLFSFWMMQNQMDKIRVSETRVPQGLIGVGLHTTIKASTLLYQIKTV